MREVLEEGSQGWTSPKINGGSAKAVLILQLNCELWTKAN